MVIHISDKDVKKPYKVGVRGDVICAEDGGFSFYVEFYICNGERFATKLYSPESKWPVYEHYDLALRELRVELLKARMKIREHFVNVIMDEEGVANGSGVQRCS